MKKLYSFWDVYKIPFVILFIAVLMVGFGDFLTNSNILGIINFENEILNLISKILKYMGGFLFQIFPILFLVRYLSIRFEDSMPVFTGIVDYFIFAIITMFLSPLDLPQYCYNQALGIRIQATTSTSSSIITRYPLFSGIIGCLLIISITSFAYKRSRRRFAYGFFGFINNDVWSFITATIITVIFGIIFALGYPYVFKLLSDLFNYIGSDIYNPTNMFIYGLIEQILSIFDLQHLLHQPFWFGRLGGSWMDNFGQTYTGDIGVWTALATLNVDSINYGRFITPYYIMNIFAIPAMIVSVFKLTTDKLKRRRYLAFAVIGIIASMFFGILWPINIFLFITAPALFFAHTVLISLLYALLPYLQIMVGYSFNGTIDNALPGTLISYLPYYNNANYYNATIRLLIFGIIYFVIYYFLTKFYYEQLSADFLDDNMNLEYNREIIMALGGTNNIRTIQSSYANITVLLYNPNKLSTESLIELGAHRILNTRAGIEIEFGPRSSNIRKGIQKEVDAYWESQSKLPAVN